MKYSLVLLPLLLAAAISCASDTETRAERSGDLAAKWAFFARPEGLTAVNLDTGEVDAGAHTKPAIPYIATPTGEGRNVLSYVDWDLNCGFSVHDRFGVAKARLQGYVAYRLGDNAILGVMVSEVLENLAGSSSVALVKTGSALGVEIMDKTTPLAPQGMLLNGDAMGLPLLMTYRPRRSLTDLYYRWQREVKFTAISSSAEKLWSVNASTAMPVADMELIGECGGVMLLYARYDYVHGEYIGLDAGSGEVLWQRASTIIPISQNEYPYADFAYQIQLEIEGGRAFFPAYDSRFSDRGKCALELSTGEARLEDDAAWLKRADAAWLAGQLPAEVTLPKSRDIGGGEKLSIGDGMLRLTSGGKTVWERKLFPHFGAGLELERAGKKLLLLVEKPAIQSRTGAQGIAHILERASGNETMPELEQGAQYFQPLIIGGKVLLLTPEGSRLCRMPEASQPEA